MGRLLYDESAHAEGISRRKSYRRRGMVLSGTFVLMSLVIVSLAIALPGGTAERTWFTGFLLLIPLALAAVAARGVLLVGFRRVYEGGIVETRGRGMPRIWPFSSLERVLLIRQPGGDTFIRLEFKRGAASRPSAVDWVTLGFASDMAGFQGFLGALAGRVALETVEGLMV